MNFLNPLALIGLAAASIPLVLHLLNLRRLQTVEFGTLRFLHELQQKQVRKLRLQQLLLLIIRTLLVIFAVLALSRPTIESKLPLLGATSRSSVVILIDNSGSMEAADGYGPRLGQAKHAAKEIVNGLRDGDEVVVLPMTGVDPTQRVDFTRTFAIAREQVDAIQLSGGTASMSASLRSIRQLLERSLHRYTEIYIVSDAQTSLSWREAADSGAVLRNDASVFLVRIGQGQKGLEQNLSIDSMNVVTKLLQPDKPIEIEAFVRNGSTKDMQGALVSLAFDNKRIAQTSVDIKAGTSKKISLAASPQRYGMISASIELESDAIDKDNIRYAGLLIPRPSRVALIGTSADQALIRTVLTLPGMERFAPSLVSYQSMSQASSVFNEVDVLMITQGTYSTQDGILLRQFIDEGGGAMIFAGNGIENLMSALGIVVQGADEASDTSPFRVKTIDKLHPLYNGVFVSTQDQTTVRETTKILRLQPASGGFDIVQTDAGPLISEFAVGRGRLLYVSVAPDVQWSTYPLTGLFAATTIRSTIYLVAPQDQGLRAGVAEAVSVPIQPRLAGTDRFVVRDASGVTTELPPARLPSATFLSVPPQFHTGVVKISTPDSTPVTTVSVNSQTAESMLNFYDAGDWETATRQFVINPDHVVELDQGTSVAKAIESARTGSELWGLFTVLALLMAATEMIVARFMAQDTAAVDPT